MSARGPERSALHRAEHLDVAHRVEAEPTRNPVTNDLDDFRGPLLRVLHIDHEEIGGLTRLYPLGHFTTTLRRLSS